MCQQCQDRIEALQATVATLYTELEHRKGIIGNLQTENSRLRRIETALKERIAA